MRGYILLSTMLLCASLGSASPAYDLSAYSGEDPAVFIDVGTGPSQDIYINSYYQGVYAANAINGGTGILSQDATGVVAIGGNDNSQAGIASYAGGTGYGVIASGPVGVWGDDAGINGGIGVEGNTYGTGSLAGLFNGDVTVTGYCACFPSDQKLKTNVRPLAYGLDQIMALQPKAYDMKVDEYKGRLNLANGPQMGMIAQDVEKIIPELVLPVHLPARQMKKRDGTIEKVAAIDYKSLNYVALVPVLIKAIQQQEAKIESLEKTVQTLSAK